MVGQFQYFTEPGRFGPDRGDTPRLCNFELTHYPAKHPFAFAGFGAETGRCMGQEYIITRIEKASVIEFRLPSLMDPLQLETIGQDLNRLVEEEDRRVWSWIFRRWNTCRARRSES